MKIRQQAAIINSIKFNGATSRRLRRSLFSTFIIPFFTWVYALHPLFTDHQRSRINRFYYTVLKRTLRCSQWNNHLFAYAFDERSFDDNCYAYWMKYLKALSHSLDGFLLIEQMYLNEHRLAWRDGNRPIRCLRRSVRFVQHLDVFSRAMEWISNHGSADSIAIFDNEDIRCLAEFPESFWRSTLKMYWAGHVVLFLFITSFCVSRSFCSISKYSRYSYTLFCFCFSFHSYFSSLFLYTSYVILVENCPFRTLRVGGK